MEIHSTKDRNGLRTSICKQIDTPQGRVVFCFTGCDPELVHEPYEVAYEKLRARLGNRCNIVWAEQVHGDHVLFCEAPQGAIECLGEGDAIIATAPGSAPLIRTADCVPILLYAENTPLVAAVHAGWRGLKKRILTCVLERIAAMGVPLADLRFIVGPFIRENSYEVGKEVAAQFAPECSRAQENGKFMLNLKKILQSELAQAEIKSDRVAWYDYDTLTTPSWFSARRQDKGRNFALIFHERIT